LPSVPERVFLVHAEDEPPAPLIALGYRSNVINTKVILYLHMFADFGKGRNCGKWNLVVVGGHGQTPSGEQAAQ
jgi:hypothetical protein